MEVIRISNIDISAPPKPFNKDEPDYKCAT